MDFKALADDHRPTRGFDLWRACTPLYTILAAVAVTTCVVLLNLVMVSQLSFFFDLCFVVICLGAGLMVRPGEVWNVALVPPALLVGVVVFLAVLSPGTVAEPDDGTVQAIITGVTGHSAALFTGYLVFGLALWTGTSAEPVQAWESFEDEELDQPSNRDGSPAPTRSTSG